MHTILLFGAGKSATVLIDYLLAQAGPEDWQVLVCDANLELARAKVGRADRGKAISFDIQDSPARQAAIREASLVISLLPPALHILVARDCVQAGRNLLTASYLDEAMRRLDADVRANNLLFLAEMGLDPGIDHMSAMQLIDGIRRQGGTITSFRSHCGGLVAPESDDNPWHYKISWNPRNVVLAGKAGAHFREDGREVRLSYEELFTPGRLLDVPGLGTLAWYPNRDSLSYAPLYGLENTHTFLRTTLRHPEFMQGWQFLVGCGLTRETPALELRGQSLASGFRRCLEDAGQAGRVDAILEKAAAGRGTDDLLARQLQWLGFTDVRTTLPMDRGSAADLLQFALESKLALKPTDRDLVVMAHEIGYQVEGNDRAVQSHLVVKGQDSLHTAMARTVGLPLGIAAKLVLQGRISLRGLQIPTHREIYEPVLQELSRLGVAFHESKK